MTGLEQTFLELRPMLFGLAYRMLGSRCDAEDVVQDCFLRWTNANTDDVRSPKSYLTTTVVRLSLDLLKSARKQRETYVGQWLPEPIASAEPDAQELADSLSIAFLHLLEKLSAPERAAFLLHDVFELDYAEIATIIGVSEAYARQIVARARKHVQEGRPRFRVERGKAESLLQSFVAACAEGDPGRIVPLLQKDVVLYSDGGGKARAALNPIFGADRVARFFEGIRKKVRIDIGSGSWAEVNAQPAFVYSLQGTPVSLITIDCGDDGLIRAVYVISNPDKLAGLTQVQ